MKQPESYFEIADLATKFLEGKLLPEESVKLQLWIDESKEHQQIWRRLTNPTYLEKQLQYWKDHEPDVYWQPLKMEVSAKQFQWKTVLQKSLRYAAIILPIAFILSTGWHFLNHKKKDQAIEVKNLASIHIMPRGKVAQLVLGNGKVINLNGSLQETITEKDGTKVHNGARALSYVAGLQRQEVKTLYNTLLIPRGGEYQVTLSDGTKVWLNAASSIRYPTQFRGKERKVFLNGEAYFEVAKDVQHPFIVIAGKTDVTVLGTKFNISSYTDDPGQKITLLEGLVRVNTGEQQVKQNNKVLLKPGYEALVGKNEVNIHVRKADVETDLAWKNGMFVFKGEPLGSIMKKLSRWYNVEVKYKDGVDTLLHFTGRIKRYENITGILNLLKLTGKVDFTVKGSEVVVKPVE